MKNQRHHLDFKEWEKEQLKDPKFKAEYDKLEPEFAVIRAMIEARMKKDFSQKKLAEKLNTTQSAIARLESGRGNPTLKFLQKLAEAFDKRLEIKFVAR